MDRNKAEIVVDLLSQIVSLEDSISKIESSGDAGCYIHVPNSLKDTYKCTLDKILSVLKTHLDEL